MTCAVSLVFSISLWLMIPSPSHKTQFSPPKVWNKLFSIMEQGQLSQVTSISVHHLNNSHFPTHAGCNLRLQLAFSGSHSTSSKCEVMHYVYHGGEDPPISAPQTEEDIILRWGANNLAWKQEAAVELSKQAGGGQGPQWHLSPQISRSHSILDLTTQPSFKQTEGNHTAHTLTNCCGSTEDTSNWSKRLVHRQSLVLTQDTEFKDLTSLPTPNYWPLASVSMPLHHSASQTGSTLLPASGNTGEIKSSVRKHFETITWVFTEMPALLNPAAPSQSIALMLQGKL